MPKIIPAHENAWLIEWGEPVSEALTLKIVATQQAIQAILGDVVVDCIPAYQTLMVVFDVGLASHESVRCQIDSILSSAAQSASVRLGETHTIPVCYAPEFGLDLQCVAQAKQVSVEQVIEWHCAQNYRVYAVGFSPAFAYLGELCAELSMARLSEPRLSVPSGSVAIADQQTAIYPVESPGGWHILGRTPMDLSLNNPKNLTRFKVGDVVQFESMTRDEFEAYHHV